MPARARRRLAARTSSTRARASRSRARFPDAEEVVAAWPEEAFAQLGGIDRATAIAVLTHDPKLDDAALRARAALRRRLHRRDGLAPRAGQSAASGCSPRASTEATSTRISAPIGLDLGALTAEETALSIMAEIVAMRHGRDGGRLAHASGRIHEVGA